MISMDEKIDPREEQRCWALGYDAAPGAANPFDFDGDGFRAAAWDEGCEDAVEKSRNFGYPAESAWGYAL